MDEIVSVLSCARVNESYFGGKTWSPSTFYYGLYRECRGGNELLDFRSFINMRSGEGGLTSFNNNNRANFPVKKSAIKLSGESIFGDYSKKLS